MVVWGKGLIFAKSMRHIVKLKNFDYEKTKTAKN